MTTDICTVFESTAQGEQRQAAEISRGFHQQQLLKKGYGQITAGILHAAELYYAQDHHQQYLAKNPDGDCGLDGTGVSLDQAR